MPRVFRIAALFAGLLLALAATGCATATIQPGHRGLLFAPHDGGLKREVLQPGAYKLGACFIACTSNRIDDFDVTYATRNERLRARSTEGLEVDLGVGIVYRPIISELYQLDTEIGPNYYDEVVGPELRSTLRGVLARHSYADLHRRDEALEDEIEAELRRRTAGRHVEIASVTLEKADYAPEIAAALRQRIAAAEEAKREQAAEEAEFARKKRALEQELELRRLREAPSCPPTTPTAAASSAPPR
jgi:regulator of protease activity HflC (stomatin/prohibitin superfamily)